MQTTLDIVAEGNNEYARRASGLLALSQQFGTLLGLQLALAIFSPKEELSEALQAKSTSCGDATSASEVCIKTLNEM